MKKSYGVKRCSEANTIDANWEKPFWREIEPAEIGLSRWPVQSEHLPKSEVKLQYDDHELYVIFRVQDQYVRAVTTQIHGEVWKDSCVEFFFAPNPNQPNAYFNVEINCCGVLLMRQLLWCPADAASYRTSPEQSVPGDCGLSTNTNCQFRFRPDSP
jgi:hypothetical protein